MNHVLHIIIFICLGWSLSSAEGHSFDHELMPPDSIHIRKSTEGHAPLLKSLLEQNDLKAFYHHAKTVLSELNAMRRHGTMTREEACDMLWSLYPIGGAPMYEAPDYDSVQPWPYKDERNNDIAAHKFFPGEEIELICCSTFEEVFANIKQDSNVIGMLAIENTIAGSLLHNYELLRESGMTIVGEHKLRIKHSFMCLPDDNWETLTEVNSHPVALAQCREFLIQHPKLKIVETEDTAGSAEAIKRENLKGHAAICSRYAADLYGMKVLEEGIETNKHNFTRFLVVADPWKADDLRERSKVNKANIVFSLPHNEGSLSQVLSIFSFYKINLTKIQSLPIIGREWEYLFYVDVIFNDYLRYKQSIDAVSPLTKELKILGEYAEGTSTI